MELGSHRFKLPEEVETPPPAPHMRPRIAQAGEAEGCPAAPPPADRPTGAGTPASGTGTFPSGTGTFLSGTDTSPSGTDTSPSGPSPEGRPGRGAPWLPQATLRLRAPRGRPRRVSPPPVAVGLPRGLGGRCGGSDQLFSVRCCEGMDHPRVVTAWPSRPPWAMGPSDPSALLYLQPRLLGLWRDSSVSPKEPQALRNHLNIPC